jgi:acetylornithine deacetylase
MSRSVEILRELVSFDTCNPPREIVAGEGIFAFVRGLLSPAWNVVEEDLGNGCVSFLAWRGKPSVLFNVHLDTVPAASGWTQDPWTLALTDERAVGLGACDIKGAAACILAAIDAEDPIDCAFLFTSDEEAGSSACVKHFCGLAGLERRPEHDLELQTVVVSEPTQCRAVTEHRGIATATARFSGVSGHASSGLADQNSALHHALDWSARLLEYGRRHAATNYGNLSGIRLNIGRVEGGVKPNMIADETTVRWGCRPLPHQDGSAMLEEMFSLTDANVEFAPGFVAPSLPAASPQQATNERVTAAQAAATRLGLPVGPPVDFWTEAALFSAAGYDTIVYGPGNIAQAHTAGEWVAVEQLDEAFGSFCAMLRGEPDHA